MAFHGHEDGIAFDLFDHARLAGHREPPAAIGLAARGEDAHGLAHTQPAAAERTKELRLCLCGAPQQLKRGGGAVGRAARLEQWRHVVGVRRHRSRATLAAAVGGAGRRRRGGSGGAQPHGERAAERGAQVAQVGEQPARRLVGRGGGVADEGEAARGERADGGDADG